MTTTVDRKYALTRIRAGSYLLPSNDAQTLWHIYSFEDGRSHGLMDEPDRTYWACARYRGTLEDGQKKAMQDLMEYGYIHWGEWTETDSYMRTRAAAIAAALTESVT
jgi:hypothetical protein